MADRDEVSPHHVLRAVLGDTMVREVLVDLGLTGDRLLLTLDRRWLDAADTIELEEVEARGIDVATVLEALNPPFDEKPAWDGRRLTVATREVLVLTLRERATSTSTKTHAGHLFLGLLASKDPLVAGTFAEHGLRLREARPVVHRRGRRAV